MSSSSALDSLLNSASDSSSSNGIDISSILSAITGNSEALDVNSAVSAAIYAARAPERVWQNDQTTLSTQVSDLQAIQTAVGSVSTDLQSLNSLTGPLYQRTVTSSSADLTATAASGTAAGTHSVVVNSLATTGSWYSSPVSSSTASLATGSFTITTKAGKTQTISTGSGTTGDTLTDLVKAINGDNLGVTASVVSDSTGSRLSLVASSSGSAADFSITAGSGGLAFTQAATGQDASLTVDGVPVDSASNTVTGAISGVTLNLLGATSGAATLTVASNSNSITTALKQFVTDYNTAIGLVTAQYTVDSSGNEGPLATDSNLSTLQLGLQGLLNYSGASSSGTTTSTVNTLADLGISENADGTLSLDTSTLNIALTNDPSDVQNFLAGSALNGFANSAITSLDTFTDPVNGAFTLDLNGMNQQYSDLGTQINNFETNYISSLQTKLTTEYSQAESALQSLPNQLAAIQAELGNNSKSNGNG
jgi:flagellar hook-associated protein 2